MDKDGKILVFDAEPPGMKETLLEMYRTGNARERHNAKFFLKQDYNIDVETLPLQPAPAIEETQSSYKEGAYLPALEKIGGITEKRLPYLQQDLFEDIATVYAADGTKIVLEKINEVALTLPAYTQKLLDEIKIEFSKHNFISAAPDYEPTNINPVIRINVKGYAAKCNENTIEQPKDCLEDREKEKKRAARALENEKRKMETALERIMHIKLFFPIEKDKNGKDKGIYYRILEGSSDIIDGEIYAVLSSGIARHLAKGQLTYYSDTLFALPDRKYNAHNIGRFMERHFHMYQNQMIGTANRLTVKTLLGVTDLPQYETIFDTDPPEVKERKEKSNAYLKKKGWRDRVKEPFEDCLDTLYNFNRQKGKNFLADWEYKKPLGEPLTDEERQNLNYEKWISLLVEFTPKDVHPQFKARLERAKAAKAAAKIKTLEKGQKSSPKGKKAPRKKAP